MTAARYRLERKKRGLTQGDLAIALGCSLATIEARENGRNRVTAEAESQLLDLPTPRNAQKLRRANYEARQKASWAQARARLANLNRKKWQDTPDEMRQIAKKARDAAPQGTEHCRAESYTLYPPAGLPIKGVKNLRMWARENATLLGKTPKQAMMGCRNMTGKYGWYGWKAERDA